MPRAFPAHLRKEFAAFKKLSTPAKVQDHLNTLRPNVPGARGLTCRSPREVLWRGTARCLEGALLAAAAFWYHGEPPLLLDLRTVRRPGIKEYDHVFALFKRRGLWGAVSKTNHVVLRYREPVYRSVRELAMSCFHEYFLDSGEKTLRSFSAPFDLRQLDADWLTAAEDLWEIEFALDCSPHQKILTSAMARNLRRADPIERAAGKLLEWEA